MLKEVLMGNCTCLLKLLLNDDMMVFINLDFILKKCNGHIKLIREKWETYCLHKTFANAVAVKQWTKQIKRKAHGHRRLKVSLNKTLINSSHQTAEHIVRQQIFKGMCNAMGRQPQNNTAGNETDLVKDFNYTLSKKLLTENLLNRKKIA